MEQAQDDSLSNNANAPLSVAQSLLENFIDEEISPQDFLQGLERFATHVEGWRQGLAETTLPEEDQEEAEVLLSGANQGLDKISQGLETLAQLTEEKRAEIAEEALQQISEGQELLFQVKQITDQNVSSVLGDSGYMD